MILLLFADTLSGISATILLTSLTLALCLLYRAVNSRRCRSLALMLTISPRSSSYPLLLIKKISRAVRLNRAMQVKPIDYPTIVCWNPRRPLNSFSARGRHIKEPAAAHHALTPGPSSPSGLSNRYNTILYTFPAAVQLTGLGVISDALVG